MTSSTGTAGHPETVAVDRPGGVDDVPVTLEPRRWVALADLHAERADAFTRGWRERRGTGVEHQIEDFLHTYYPARPAQLRRWHPGAGVTLAAEPDVPGATERLDDRSTWRWYAVSGTGATLDVAAFLADRRDTVTYVRDLLVSTASRPAALGCFGLHEWAMVYRQGGDTRHSLPLRLGPEGTDAVVEAHPVRCTHIDAFRFFTPEAKPLNQLQPTRDTQRDLEQPGCLHAGMDLLKWALKLGPAAPGDLLLDCFELARDIRVLDMQASPYDVSSLGQEAVPIETPQGRAEYVRRQRGFADRGQVLRARLVAVCDRVLALG